MPSCWLQQASCGLSAALPTSLCPLTSRVRVAASLFRAAPKKIYLPSENGYGLFSPAADVLQERKDKHARESDLRSAIETRARERAAIKRNQKKEMETDRINLAYDPFNRGDIHINRHDQHHLTDREGASLTTERIDLVEGFADPGKHHPEYASTSGKPETRLRRYHQTPGMRYDHAPDRVAEDKVRLV